MAISKGFFDRVLLEYLMAIRFKDPFMRLRLFGAALVLLNNSEQVKRSTKVLHINLDNIWMF